MKNLTFTFSVAWKEIQLILRDRGNLAILFLLPLLIGGFYGGMNLQFSDGEEPDILLHVGLVNRDVGGSFGQEISKALRGIDQLDVEVFTTTEAEGKVAEGELAAAIVIPADFSEKIDAYTPTTIEVIVDPAQPESASIVTGIMNRVVAEVTIWGEVQYGIRTILDESGLLAEAGAEDRRAIEAQNLGVIMTQLNEIRRNPAIEVVTEDLEGVQNVDWVPRYFAYLFPGLSVMFIFFIIGMAGQSLLAERESGTLRRLLAAPIPRGAIIAGKMLAFMLLACTQVVVLFGVANLIFGMPLGNSPGALVALTLGAAFCATALGMMVAALAKTASQAGNIGTILGFVLAGLGGAIAVTGTPLPRSGGIMGTLTKLTPHGHAIEGYYSVMAENATFGQVLPEVGVLFGMGIVLFAIALWRFEFK